jgi:hypothetical protein
VFECEINDLEGMGFGPYAAEGFLADDESIEVNTVLDAFGVTPQDVSKMSEYIGQFSVDKIWEDKDPNRVFTYLERPENQTPENIKKADAFFLNDEDAMFSGGAWNYAQDIRANVKGTMDTYVAELGPSVKKAAWKELEEAFINRLDRLLLLNKAVKSIDECLF